MNRWAIAWWSVLCVLSWMARSLPNDDPILSVVGYPCSTNGLNECRRRSSLSPACRTLCALQWCWVLVMRAQRPVLHRVQLITPVQECSIHLLLCCSIYYTITEPSLLLVNACGWHACMLALIAYPHAWLVSPTTNNTLLSDGVGASCSQAPIER